MAQGFSLADQLVNPDTIGMFAQGFDAVFDPAQFTNEAMSQVADMALMDRLRHMATMLEQRLDSDFPTAAEQIRAAMPPPLDPTKSDDDFGHFIYAPLGVFVERQAIADHFECGLDLLRDITMRFSMEFSLRPFIIHNPSDVLSRAQGWAKDDNYHVRRLASEGTRPRLPWGQNVGLRPQDTMPILDALHSDPTRYVTRSVANHLNDITKIDPECVVSKLDDWIGDGLQHEKELLWMRKHALRGLVKSGNPAAMLHLGYRPDTQLDVATISIPDQVAPGAKAMVSVEIVAANDAPLIVDYVVHFQKANGKTSAKTFKLKTLDARAGKQVSLSKLHHFKDTATTFKLFSGAHRIDLQVNGRIVAGQDFTVT